MSSFLTKWQPTRRAVLKTAFMAVLSASLPKLVLAAGRNPTSFWFLHAATGESWAVDDPVLWSLENARQPILERARERLLRLDTADPQRVIRLVVRRCGLNLIEVSPGQVVVHFWGQEGQADLRPFFKHQNLARKDIQVTLTDRKREVSTIAAGEDFLYGDPVFASFPLKRYLTKWRRRYQEEPDDWGAAPDTWSGFGWEGIEPNRIPWKAMKSAWRKAIPFLCLNCDLPTILTNFGLRHSGMFNRYPSFRHACRECRRMIEDDSISRWNVEHWIVKNLDAQVLPTYTMSWSNPVKWEPPL